MSNKKQTAVEWLAEAIDLTSKINSPGIKCIAIKQVVKKAKELEKQQMEICAIFFTNYAIDKIENKTNLKGEEQFEQYYTETYEQ